MKNYARCRGCNGDVDDSVFCDACYHSLPLYMRRGLQQTYSCGDVGGYIYWVSEAVHLIQYRITA